LPQRAARLEGRGVRLTIHNHGGFPPRDDDRGFAGSRVRVRVYAARLAVYEATDVVFQRSVVSYPGVELVGKEDD